MISFRIRSFALTALGLLTSGAAYGQFAEDALRFSTFNAPVGARSMALGGTSVARAEDYTALFSNPAGLASLRDYEFSIGFARNGITNDAGYLGTVTGSDNSATLLDHVGLVYPIPTTRGSLSFALGYGRVANFTSTANFGGFNATSSIVPSMLPGYTHQNKAVDLYQLTLDEERELLRRNIPYQIWLADTMNGFLYPILTDSVGQTGTVFEGGGVNHWSFGGAVDVARNLSLGFSLNFVSGTYSYDREFVETDSRGVYQSSYAFPYNVDRFSYVSTIESELSGFNMLFGLLMRQQGRYRIGLALRTPTTLELQETFTDEGKSFFDDGSSYEKSFSDRTTYKVVTPVVFSGGASVNVTDWLALSGDAEYTDWTQVRFDSDHPDLLAENRYIKKSFRETVNLKGGVEVHLWDLGVVLRGGYSLVPSPYKDDPSSYDQRVVTGGLGVRLDSNAMLNVGGSFGRWSSFRDNYYIDGLPPASTTEALENLRISVGVTYRF
ncbi:MAG: hypothetical protein MUE68_02340 [Bacteroidetes bacterium]|jgi:hypothetical protein|nr:hypothetical protein [Bacteroidota bacterium]